MIRRGFWLAVGATGGIIGYRRAASLGRSLSGANSQRTHAQGTVSRKRQAGRGLARGAIRLTGNVRRFNRDVREGMDLYLARHPGRRSPTLGPSKVNDERVKDDR